MAKLRTFTLVAAFLGAAAAAPMVACGEDDSNIVRQRPDGGGDASLDGGDGGPNSLSCGVSIPATYESAAFATNAKGELDLKAHLGEIHDKVRATENTGTATVTAPELQAIFTAGSPSLRSVATAAAQSTVDTYITQLGAAMGKTWSPPDAEVDGGPTTGGKYEGTTHYSASGVELREGIEKHLLGGAFYNFALAIASGVLTEATIDRLLAVYGATPNFAHVTGTEAGVDADELIAEYAAKRDNGESPTPGAYRKIRSALIVARTAAAGGEKCRPDLDAALKIYFLEWERATYATAIYYLNAAATSALASPVKGPQAMHALGEALGLIDSFRGIPQDRRKITDVQIDALLTRVGGATPYQLITRTSERVVAFNTAFNDIGAIYGMTQTEIEDSKKAY